ncbi:YveK family protein [Marinilactibacillus kalidii]|uniref:YveK family protein n=1 Tax=Marinilactibacillus kalidii TaxID=2820274 RepID=UPI001ABE1894|nr:Wzz/FepE/Etk N-terminal domain-containing protein [Marinilactibacillus kalidii]
MQEEINLLEMLSIIRKRLVMIINTMIFGMLLAAVYTFFIATPQYNSTTQLLVNRTQESEIIQRADIDTNVQLINTYSDIINNAIILNPVIEELNLNQTTEQLKEQISVSAADNSQVFTLQVTDDNPYQAADIANTISTEFRDNLNSIMNVDNVTIISEAISNTKPVSPNNTFNLIVGLVLGGLIGVIISFLIEFLDSSVKDEKFIVDELGWINLGIISKMNGEELKSSNQSTMHHKNKETRASRSRI